MRARLPGTIGPGPWTGRGLAQASTAPERHGEPDSRGPIGATAPHSGEPPRAPEAGARTPPTPWPAASPSPPPSGAGTTTRDSRARSTSWEKPIYLSMTLGGGQPRPPSTALVPGSALSQPRRAAHDDPRHRNAGCISPSPGSPSEHTCPGEPSRMETLAAPPGPHVASPFTELFPSHHREPRRKAADCVTRRMTLFPPPTRTGWGDTPSSSDIYKLGWRGRLSPPTVPRSQHIRDRNSVLAQQRAGCDPKPGQAGRSTRAGRRARRLGAAHTLTGPHKHDEGSPVQRQRAPFTSGARSSSDTRSRDARGRGAALTYWLRPVPQHTRQRESIPRVRGRVKGGIVE